MTEAMESWRAIPGEPGYEASSLGRVRSVNRHVQTPTGLRRQAGKLCRGTPGRDGHLYIYLPGNRNRAVHRLVAETFLGPLPVGLQTRHLDGDPSNNRVDNLQYGTGSQNMQDAVRHGTHHMTRRTHRPRGHELVEPNLRPDALSAGRRGCLACHRARYRTSSAERSAAADRHYAEIMRASETSDAGCP